MAITSITRMFLLPLLGASLSLASPMLATRQSTDATHTVLGYPVLASGPYPFVSCNATQGAALTSLFPQIAEVINSYAIPAIETEGQRDRINNWQANSYSTFFTAGKPPDVQAVFEHMVARSDTNSAGTPIKRPNIICLNEDVAELKKSLAVCDTPMKPTSFTRQPQGSVAGANTDIYLCPSFWDLEAAYDPLDQSHCPSAPNPDNHLYGDHNNIANTQSSTILHALAHIYSPTPLAFGKETYPLNKLLALSHENQLNNANNYAYFAAVIYSSCPSFYDLTKVTAKLKRQTASASRPYIPAILDDWQYDIAFDANALQANLTALGY